MPIRDVGHLLIEARLGLAALDVAAAGVDHHIEQFIGAIDILGDHQKFAGPQAVFLSPLLDVGPKAIQVSGVQRKGGEPEEHLARSFDAALREELATEFDLVETAQGGTLRLRSAVAMKTPSLLGIEVELLDAVSGKRVVAAVDERPVSGVDHERARAQRDAELARWAGVIRTRLAAFRSFDAAQRDRGEEEAP